MSSAVLWSPGESLLRSGGQWYLVCESLAGMDKVPTICRGELSGAELCRQATPNHIAIAFQNDSIWFEDTMGLAFVSTPPDLIGALQ